MQGESETFRDFSERTDNLAVRLGIDLGELAKKLDMGRASFFSYRTGKRNITGKAWAKLEAAEREAGIGAVEEPPRNDNPSTPDDTSPTLLALLKQLPAQDTARVASLVVEAQLINHLNHAEALAHWVQNLPPYLLDPDPADDDYDPLTNATKILDFAGPAKQLLQTLLPALRGEDPPNQDE